MRKDIVDSLACGLLGHKIFVDEFLDLELQERQKQQQKEKETMKNNDVWDAFINSVFVIPTNQKLVKIAYEYTPYLVSYIPTIAKIKQVIHNNPATVVIWEDNSKTIVKCQEGDTYDKEKGLLACIAKKVYGNKGKFNDILKEWCE